MRTSIKMYIRFNRSARPWTACATSFISQITLCPPTRPSTGSRERIENLNTWKRVGEARADTGVLPLTSATLHTECSPTLSAWRHRALQLSVGFSPGAALLRRTQERLLSRTDRTNTNRSRAASRCRDVGRDVPWL